MTRYHKAGRLVRLVGWIELATAVVLVLITMVVIPVDRSARGTDALLLAVLVLFLFGVGAFYLKIGSAIKEHRPWARTAGIVISCLMLCGFPIGTLIGGFVLYYLITGWNDVGQAGQAASN